MKILNMLAIATMAVLIADPSFAGGAVCTTCDGVSASLPEPGTLALLAGGVATALIIRRRKK